MISFWKMLHLWERYFLRKITDIEQWFPTGVPRNPWKALGVPPSFELGWYLQVNFNCWKIVKKLREGAANQKVDTSSLEQCFNLGSAHSLLRSTRILKLALFWVSRFRQKLNNLSKVPRATWKRLKNTDLEQRFSTQTTPRPVFSNQSTPRPVFTTSYIFWVKLW